MHFLPKPFGVALIGEMVEGVLLGGAGRERFFVPPLFT